MKNIDIKQQEYFSNNLKELMHKNNLTQQALAEKLNTLNIKVGQTTISNWINKNPEKVIIPSQQKIDALCKVLNCSMSDLIQDVNPPKPHPTFLEVARKRFPVLGEVNAGKPIWEKEDKDCFVMADPQIDADFVVIARGDSMIGIGIKNGDLVFIKRQDIVRNEEVAVVSIDDETTLKRIIYDKLNNKMTLKAENPKYEDLVYSGEQLDHIKILGRAVFYQSLIQ